MTHRSAWTGIVLVALLGACGEREDEAAAPETEAAKAPAATAPAHRAPAPTAQAEPPAAAPVAGLPDQLNAYGCFACHGMNEVRIGPPYRAIAAMYRNQPDAVDKLTRKVIEGGGGVWGPVPMISHPQYSEEHIRPLIEAILAIQ
jgi:cytochrome c